MKLILTVILSVFLLGCSGKHTDTEEPWSYNDDYIPNTNLIVGGSIALAIVLRSPITLVGLVVAGCSSNDKSYNPCTDPYYKTVPCLSLIHI